MGALLGLTFGVGLVLIVQSVTGAPPWGPRGQGQRRPNRLAELISAAGLEAVTPRQVVVTSAGLGLAVGLGFLALSRTWPIALVFGAFAAYGPVLLIRVRARKRRAELRELWPDAVDSLASAVRAGLSLPEALTQLGTRGPAALREPFERFGEDYRATDWCRQVLLWHACERLSIPESRRARSRPSSGNARTVSRWPTVETPPWCACSAMMTCPLLGSVNVRTSMS